MIDELERALDQGDVAEAARLIADQKFTLIELPDESDEEGHAIVSAEVDGQPGIVAFTSSDHAGVFAGSIPELAGDDGDVLGVLVDGDGIFAYLPEGFGLLLNPESDNPYFLSPEFIGQIEEVLGESE